MISYEKAIDITKQFANNVKDLLKDKLLAVFAIGSLGSDYYRPGQSDIDTIIITSLKREDLKIYRKDIRKLADSFQKKYDVPKGFGAILLAKEQLYPPYKYDEELILEIYRIKKQSKLVYGHYDIRTIPFPSKKDIIQDAIAFENWRQEEHKNNPDFKIDNNIMLVNSTLMMLKRYIMIKWDIIEFNKFKVIDLYMKNNPPYVDEELFEFIEKSLHSEDYEVDEDTFKKFVHSHDELTKIINYLVLTELDICPKYIFFDVGTTLVDEEKAYDYRAYEMIQNTNITFEEFDNKRIELAKQGLDGNSVAIKELGLTKTRWPSEKEILYDDAIELLEYLKNKKYKLGIVANQKKGLQKRLDEFGILEYFDLVISSEEVGVSKPDKEIFNIALSKTSCKPQECIMIGDRLDNDILPANQIGMKTIWIRQGLAKYQDIKLGTENANFVVSSLSEIEDIL